ncbi:MAG: HTH domain-containing protein [Candidatus Hermodarchaeota archaeon]
MSNPEIKSKVLSFLQENHPKDFNIQEIANTVNVHRNTVSTYVKVLVAERKLKISRKMGKITLYSYVKE